MTLLQQIDDAKTPDELKAAMQALSKGTDLEMAFGGTLAGLKWMLWRVEALEKRVDALTKLVKEGN